MNHLQGRVLTAVVAAAALAMGVTSCSEDDDKEPAVAPTSTALPDDLGVHQHEYQEGETFAFKFSSTDATYSATSADEGKIPRVKDLRLVEEVRADVRFTIVKDGAELKKKIEITDPEFRELKPSDLAGPDAAAVAFRPASEKVAGFPSTISYTYDIGTDAEVALRLDEVFDGPVDPFAYKYIDIFNFPSTISSVPDGLEPGQGATRDGVDVDLGGVTFHSGNQTFVYDRVDQLDGVPTACFKLQTPGNHIAAVSTETNVQQTFEVPLTGPLAGLVTNGELQEIIFSAGTSITVTVRQASMAMQTDTTRTAVESD